VVAPRIATRKKPRLPSATPTLTRSRSIRVGGKLCRCRLGK
jgi:hypothetical protein